MAKMWEKHLKKKVRKGPTSLLKISLWASSLSARLNQPHGFSVGRKHNIDSKWVVPNNWWIKQISELLQMAPLTTLNFC